MALIIDLIGSYVFGGIPSSAAWELLKLAWTKATTQSWEDLYLSSFKQALKESRPYLAKYSRGEDPEIDLDEPALRRSLNYDLAVDTTSIPFFTLAEEQFASDLARAMVKRSVLTIGGNELSEDDYTQIVRGLIGHARSKFYAAIRKNEDAFRQAILESSLAAQQQLNIAVPAVLESQASLGELKEQVAALVEHLEQTAEQDGKFSDAKAGATDSESLRTMELDYLRRISDRFDQWKLRFVPLSAVSRDTSGNEDATAVQERQNEHPEFIELRDSAMASKPVYFEDIRELITNCPSFVLLGDSGSGKTSVLKWLCYETSRRSLVSEEGQLPIFINLRDCRADQSLLDLVAQSCGPSGLSSRLSDYLHSGRLLLVFDGANEIPMRQRSNAVLELQVLGESWQRQGNRVVVSCRELEYDNWFNEMPVITIEPLTEAQIRSFLAREIPESWEELWKSLTGPRGDDLLELVENPYLLTMIIQMFLLKAEGLPQNRSLVIQRFVRTLLARERLRRDSESAPSTEAVLFALSQLAIALQKHSGAGAHLSTATAINLIPSARQSRTGSDKEYIDPQAVFELGVNANLLWMAPDRSTVGFSHQLLHEYFSALSLQGAFERTGKLQNFWPDGWWMPTGWEEVAVLMVGLSEAASNIVQWLDTYNPVVSARCIVESGRPIRKEQKPATIELLHGILRNKSVPASGRIDAALQLGRLGGSGASVLACSDIEWCEITGGPFKMGVEPFEFELESFSISKFPITSSQFDEFVNDNGYGNEVYWTPSGRQWKSQVNCAGPDNIWLDRDDPPNLPRVGISWYEAVAFANWYSRKYGFHVCLPSEAEWEKAARGKDGNIFPWGNDFDKENCNSVIVGRGLAPVGCFPGGVSSFGVHDMCGNVWEWCSTAYSANWEDRGATFIAPYRYDERESVELGLNATRVVKGGSYQRSIPSFVCSERSGYYQDHQRSDLGFRLVKRA